MLNMPLSSNARVWLLTLVVPPSTFRKFVCPSMLAGLDAHVSMDVLFSETRRKDDIRRLWSLRVDANLPWFSGHDCLDMNAKIESATDLGSIVRRLPIYLLVDSLSYCDVDVMNSSNRRLQ
jgi:hypothetical protein